MKERGGSYKRFRMNFGICFQGWILIRPIGSKFPTLDFEVRSEK